MTIVLMVVWGIAFWWVFDHNLLMTLAGVLFGFAIGANLSS